MAEEPQGPTRESQSTSTGERLRTDTVFDALQNRRRRYTLHCLLKFDGLMALADIADEIAIRENGKQITEIPGEEVRDIYMNLYHSHIPRLADAGIVEYNQERDTVALGENADQVEPYLDIVFTE